MFFIKGDPRLTVSDALALQMVGYSWTFEDEVGQASFLPGSMYRLLRSVGSPAN